jgi:methyltransferase (TIGR00027 family)
MDELTSEAAPLIREAVETSRAPSRTARGTALHRAAHQVLEGGAVFCDPFACAILGDTPEHIAAQEGARLERRPMRLFIAARSRFADEAMTAAYERGTREMVVLGAGLDTFALRHADADLRVFEVDHPATQAWKRERLAEAGLPLPSPLVFVPVDFEGDRLGDRLREHGFDVTRAACFSWLGVVPYLTREAIEETLRLIARVPDGEVVFDYSEPLERYTAEGRARATALAERVAAAGEPFVTFCERPDLHGLLRRLGFTELEDHEPGDIAVRYLGVRPVDAPRRRGPHLLRARR